MVLPLLFLKLFTLFGELRMRIWKGIFFTALICLLALSAACNSVHIEKEGDVIVEHIGDSKESKKDHKYLVKTQADGFFNASAKNFHVMMPPGSVAELDLKAGDYQLLKGTIILTKAPEPADESVIVRYYLKNQWGGCQFVRLTLPENYSSFSSECSVQYNMVKGNPITINPKLHYLYTGADNKNYYGFFVPYDVYMEVSDINIKIELTQEEENAVLIEINKKVASREFDAYKLNFQPAKSRELKKTRQKGNYREEHAVRKEIWKEDNELIFFDKGFDYPLETSERLTSDFGVVREYYLSGGKFFSKSTHLGLDFGRPQGTEITAAAGGIVRYTKNGAYVGNTVIIEHGMGLFTDYSHMDTITVKEGQVVKKGEQIGTVGSTGTATGSHLHWGARVFGMPIDARSFLAIGQIFSEQLLPDGQPPEEQVKNNYQK